MGVFKCRDPHSMLPIGDLLTGLKDQGFQDLRYVLYTLQTFLLLSWPHHSVQLYIYMYIYIHLQEEVRA